MIEPKNILQQIKADQLKARKDKDRILAGVLSCLLGEVSIIGKDKGNRDTTDEEAIVVIAKFKKDASFGAEKLIEDGMDKNYTRIQEITYEIEIYESYLPKQLTQQELMDIIEEYVRREMDTMRQVNMGGIMKHLRENYAKQYDGKQASNIAQRYL